MKNKKGFTLIELLAVIVILAIIALIAVPVVMDIIGKVNKSAFKDSAYGLLKAGEFFYADQLLENGGDSTETTFTFLNDIEGLEFQGSKPTDGYMTVNKDGEVSMAISNGKYCITKGFDDDDVTISDDIENCVAIKNPYKLGDIVYFDPTRGEMGEMCTENEYDAENNSLPGFSDGCMRWYVYAVNGNNVKLILDHNIKFRVDSVNKEYNEFGQQWIRDNLFFINWEINVDMLSLEELLEILPWYNNLEDKSNWELQYDIDMSVVSEEVMANLDLSQFSTMLDMYKALTNVVAEHKKGIGLPKFLYEDLLSSCIDVEIEPYIGCPTYGYWMKSASDSLERYNWTIDSLGVIKKPIKEESTMYGSRTVIELTYSKEKLVNPDSLKTKLNSSKKLSDLATTHTFTSVDGKTTSKVSKVHACAKSGICNPGTPFAIKVNDNKIYKFYVLSDNGKEVTLIMDRDFHHVLSEIDLDLALISALGYLNYYTSDWYNIGSIKNYTYNNNLNGTTYRFGYQKFQIVDGRAKLISLDGQTVTEISRESKARLLTYEEATSSEIGCTKNAGNCPSWLYENLGFSNYDLDENYLFLSTAHTDSIGDGYVWVINEKGSLTESRFAGSGIRPVITISK